jgi:hypothetical protein
MSEAARQGRSATIAIVITIALVCVGALIVLVRDRWHPPEIKSVEQARSSMTGRVTHAAGAILLPTDPKLVVEPKPAGPKQAQPAVPN